MFVLIKNARVYDPQDGGINDVLICNDRIIRIEPQIIFSEPDTEVIEASGKLLVPGFIDQHVHIIGGGGEDGFASLIREVQMTDCVRSGVTSVVGLLGTDHHAKSVETLVARTKALKEQGMSAWCLTGSYVYPSNTLTGSVGRDIAFIDEIIGVKVAISDHRSSDISADELARLATEARTAGLLAGKPGYVHMHTGHGKKGYTDVVKIINETDIPVSQFRPTHFDMDFPGAEEFIAMGGYADFTSGTDTAGTAARLKNAMGRMRREQMTLSSDSNGSFPQWDENKQLIGMGVGRMETLFDTIRHLIIDQNVQIGDALTLITSNVAQALQLYPRKGTVTVNADADLVLLDQDLNIDTVLALGKTVVRNGIPCVRNYYDYE